MTHKHVIYSICTLIFTIINISITRNRKFTKPDFKTQWKSKQKNGKMIRKDEYEKGKTRF